MKTKVVINRPENNTNEIRLKAIPQGTFFTAAAYRRDGEANHSMEGSLYLKVGTNIVFNVSAGFLFNSAEQAGQITFVGYSPKEKVEIAYS